MRIATLIVCLLVLATGALAEKAAVQYPNVTVNSDRQGGDTIASATALTEMPIVVMGTTAGYSHDYDEICDYDIPGALDVVYSFVACADGTLEASLCEAGTAYDTKLYVYETDEFTLVACNDDSCPDYTSRLLIAEGTQASVTEGMTYYFVVDGWSAGDEGAYELNIWGMDCGVTASEESNFSSVKSMY